MSVSPGFPEIWEPQILSASWGDADVTRMVQGICDQQLYTITGGDMVNPSEILNITFVPTVGLFGNLDPFPGHPKTLVVVYKMNVVGQTKISPFVNPQTLRIQENQTCEISGRRSLVDPPRWTPTVPQDGVAILAAFYGTHDITSTIAALTFPGGAPGQKIYTTIQVPVGNSTLVGPDPQVGIPKQCCITYAYFYSATDIEVHMQTAREGGQINILTGPPVRPPPPPPHLNIRAANFGGEDVTSQIQALVTSDQKFQIMMSPFPADWTDPRPGVLPDGDTVQKTLSILYQWDGRPLELLVTHDGTGKSVIDPNVAVDSSRTRYFLTPDNKGLPSEPLILAVIWGIMQGRTTPVDPSAWQQIQNTGTLTPSNTFFGFDGSFNNPKTCQIFYEWVDTGKFGCFACNEGTALVNVNVDGWEKGQS
ncbi:hypothetical protein LTR97_005684 [Elasticomyces elasticus]|uniref:Uncharacterized protein n=1 Tax=Elasticomyces elasticus TaxID=574655 RepID=A0AAN7W746_9PEZI|nr:hypothetical protein LTR97_005684 [Elasticomyces elasticus]